MSFGMGISTTLYRALHRALRQLQQANSGSDLQVRLPVDLCNTKWGSYRTVASTDVFVQETRDYLGALASDLEPAVVRPEPPKVPMPTRDASGLAGACT